jgi:hypothetical protein
MSVKVYKAELTKARLEAMPEADRTALLLLGHASNEIGMLRKLLLVAMNGDVPDNKIVDHVQAGQTLILLRMLLGKVHEAWLLFSKRVQPLRKKYLPGAFSGSFFQIANKSAETRAEYSSSMALATISFGAKTATMRNRLPNSVTTVFTAVS